MKILITGAGGQLGRILRDISVEFDHECIFTDVVGAGDVVALDVTDADAVMDMMKTHDVDVVVNCAGYTDVDKAESEEEKAYMINAAAPGILAAAAKETGAVMIHISTDYVFGGEANTPYAETDEPSPLGVYGRTKLEGEKAVAESGCGYIILRTAWLYSRYGKNFFKTIEAKAADCPSLNVVVDQVGAPTYACDLARAIFMIIDDGKLGNTGVYHYSDEGICSWYDFAKAINREFGYLCDVRPCRSADYPSPVKRPAYSALDKSLFKKTFGYEIPHWEDSLNMCVRDFLSK